MSINKNKLAIIIPVFNEEDIIEKVINDWLFIAKKFDGFIAATVYVHSFFANNMEIIFINPSLFHHGIMQIFLALNHIKSKLELNHKGII